LALEEAAPGDASSIVRLRLQARFSSARAGSAPPTPRVLRVTSAGFLCGDRARIVVDGEDVAPNRRGYNVAVLEPRGEVVRVDAFDLVDDPEGAQARRMAELLEAVPAGWVVCVAVRD